MDNSLNDLINSIGDSLTYGDLLAGEVLAKISATIFRERIDRGMTQKEFANLLGVSQGMISKWESEDYNFSIEALANICDKLDWDLNVEMRPRSSKSFNSISNRKSREWVMTNSLAGNVIRFGEAS